TEPETTSGSSVSSVLNAFRQRKAYDVASAGRSRRTCSPMLTEPVKTVPPGTKPHSLWRPTAARPAEAMHPHCEQSGLPPNWHGVMRCSKSAEMHEGVCAKMHSSGLLGGVAYCLTSPSGIAIFLYLRLSDISAATTRSRSSGRRI